MHPSSPPPHPPPPWKKGRSRNSNTVNRDTRDLAWRSPGATLRELFISATRRSWKMEKPSTAENFSRELSSAIVWSRHLFDSANDHNDNDQRAGDLSRSRFETYIRSANESSSVRDKHARRENSTCSFKQIGPFFLMKLSKSSRTLRIKREREREREREGGRETKF